MMPAQEYARMILSGRRYFAGFLLIALLTVAFASLYYYMAAGLQRQAQDRVQALTRFSSLLIWDRLRSYSQTVDLLANLSPRSWKRGDILSDVTGINNEFFHVHVAFLTKQDGLLYFDEHTGKIVRADDSFAPQWQEALSSAEKEVSVRGPLPSLGHDGEKEVLFVKKFKANNDDASLALAVRERSFENSLLSLGLLNRDGRHFFLMDEKGAIIASSEGMSNLKNMCDLPLMTALHPALDEQAVIRLGFQGRSYFVCAAEVHNTGWRIYFFSPEKVELTFLPVLGWALGTTWLILCVCVALMRYLSKQQNKYKTLSELDHLTGAHNRLAFEKKLEELKNDHCYPISLIVMDVDGLKIINDALGHEEGDALLRRVMLLLQRSLRDDDAVYRLGGDEFAVILQGAAYATAQSLAERITVQAATMREKTGLPPVFLSLGFAEAMDNETYATLFARADEAMYSNKRLRKDAAHRAILRWVKKHPAEFERRKRQGKGAS